MIKNTMEAVKEREDGSIRVMMLEEKAGVGWCLTQKLFEKQKAGN